MLPLDIRVLTDCELDAVAGGASLDADANSMPHVDRDAAESATSPARGVPRSEGVRGPRRSTCPSGTWVR